MKKSEKREVIDQPKRKRGRPPEDSRFKPTEEQRRLVEMGCGLGIPEDELARVIINPKTNKPIAAMTLRKHFRAELDRGLIKTRMRVGAALVRTALGVEPTEHHAGLPGNVTAQIFYLKTQAGWKEPAPAPVAPSPEEQDAAQAAAAAQIPEERNRLEIARRIAFAMIEGARNLKQQALPAPKKAPSKA